MNNNIAYFTNERINNIAGLTEKPDEVYDILKGYYLEEALNSADSPMSSFEKLIFNQTIYPPQQYTYKSYTRARTVFNFNWNSDIEQRQQEDASNNFARGNHARMLGMRSRLHDYITVRQSHLSRTDFCRRAWRW